jgi:hypothetical protein
MAIPTSDAPTSSSDAAALGLSYLTGPGDLISGVMSAAISLSTSGTSIDFTSIPAWVKRITVMFNGVSTNGTSNIQAKIGAGSITSTGYKSAAIINNNASNTGLTIYTTGFGMDGGSPAATTVRYGVMTIVSMGSNVWAYTYNGYMETYAFAGTASGTVTLSGTLDRVRLTTVNGTDTFDAGSINIMYEG